MLQSAKWGAPGYLSDSGLRLGGKRVESLPPVWELRLDPRFKSEGFTSWREGVMTGAFTTRPGLRLGGLRLGPWFTAEGFTPGPGFLREGEVGGGAGYHSPQV